MVVWGVMGGWFPERLPVIVAMLDIEHMDGLLNRLLAIRVALDRIKSESKNG